MNFEKLGSSTLQAEKFKSSDSREHSSIETSHLQQKDTLLSSIPSDTDWVSPFTLPPLPTLHRTRGQSTQLSSLNHSKQREGSGAYYAAAWGSPYATPSPRKGAAHNLPQRTSFDSNGSSPLQARHTARIVTEERSNILARGHQGTASLWKDSEDRPKHRSERNNWLSDSEASDLEEDLPPSEQTPTRYGYLGDWADPAAEALDGDSGLPTHQVHESVSTITPETFHLTDVVDFSTMDRTQVDTTAAPKTSNSTSDIAIAQSPSKEGKPLPHLPGTTMAGDMSQVKPPEPSSPARLRPTSKESSQRPKKKVVWKGKSCIIALPLTDRESANLPPILSAKEVQDSLRSWIQQGYNINGFDLADSTTNRSIQSSGQSRALFPDPLDVHAERQTRQFNIRIPDQAQWLAWVDYLKEEKLRALGVTPSNSEAPTSTQSPFSASLSRTSSRYPSLVPSPPVGTSSAASNLVRTTSNPLRATSTPFSPTFGASPPNGPPNKNVMGGTYGGLPAALHGYKQSIAQPVIQSRMTSPYDYPISQPSSMGPSSRSPPQAFNPQMGSFSPNNSALIQSLAEVLSPVSPLPPSESLAGVNTNAGFLVATSQGTSPSQSAVGQSQPSPASMPQIVDDLPRTPAFGNPSKSTLEIAHPTPRSHRHNLSAALQKEIDEAEAALENEDLDSQTREIPSLNSQDVDDHEGTAQDELPILKRPDTINSIDEKSDIETNPSIAASPMLMDDKNPFANWQALSDAAKDQSKSSHQVKPSMSRLNVQAKEFNPLAGFSSSNFTTGGNFFQSTPPSQPQATPPSSKNNKGASVSNFNVEAPTFTPGAGLKSPQSYSSPFKFGSATTSTSTFNVEAPEFNPMSPPVLNFGSSVGSVLNDPIGSSRSIFGEIVIDPNSKVNRRSSKAVPIMNPKSPLQTDNSFESDDGRPSLPADRQKRARRIEADDRDSSFDFAERAPPEQALSRTAESEVASEVHNKVDADASFMDKEMMPETPSKASTQQVITPMDEAQFVVENPDDVVKFSVAHPDSPLGNDTAEESDTQRVDADSESPKRLSPFSSQKSSLSHKPKSSLSALALEFRPSLPYSPSLETSTTPRKSLGLEASRFASDFGSPISPPSQLSFTSPPSQLYQYISATNDSSPVKELDDSLEKENDLEDDKSSDVHHHEPSNVNELEQANEINPEEIASLISDNGGEPMPSYEEIDAVMKQFENDPDLGIERNDTPIQSTPLLDLHMSSKFRSDAPSPSPTRPRKIGTFSDTSSRAAFGLGIHKLNSGKDDISDWNDVLSANEEEKLQSRANFFDGHVNSLVDGLLEHRLGPLERTLETIQHSLTLLAVRPQSKGGRQSLSTDVRESDADDEEDYNAFEDFATYRSRSPRRERKPDKIRTIVAETVAAYNQSRSEPPPVDIQNIQAALAELRELASKGASQTNQADLKSVVEDVISHHPRLRGQRVQQEHDASESKFKLQIDGLESMLKAANERVEEEARERGAREEEIADLNRRLASVEEEAVQYREASEEAQHSIMAFVEEKKAYQSLEEDFDNLNLKNAALETTLEEYRVSSEQWRDDIHNERVKNQELSLTLQHLRDQFEEGLHSRQVLRSKVERLQQHISQAINDLTSEQADWRRREHDLLGKHRTVQDALDHEIRRREKGDREFEALHKQHTENLNFKLSFAQAQEELGKLQDTLVALRQENKTHQDEKFQLERELGNALESKDTGIATATAKLEAQLEGTKLQLEGAKSQLESLRSDSEARINRLQSRLDNAEIDIEDQKATHEALMSEAVETHAQALREANEKREIALEEQHSSHEKKLNDLRERHTRALHNSSDDRHRLEHMLNEKLNLSEDKTKHFESKVADLEERLEITKSAARAAVEAATAKGVDLPTPAPSVVASPPHRAATASMPFIKGSEIPEKISPQALRESILVLQEQLQNREQKIERLEAELAIVDKEAPAKLKERDNEIAWLRELVGVRLDDLDEIITTLSKPDFDREAAKDAAIRLKANLQMEQQLRERAAAGLMSSLPSLSTLSSYAQTPKALPMAAAAAWGNWRKARDTGIGALSDFAVNISGQTPSKVSAASPASFLAGIMTPPTTAQKTPSTTDTTLPPPSMRPLAAAAAARKAGSSEARPLRAYNNQPRTLSSRPQEKRPESPISQGRPESPHTPTTLRPMIDLGDDVDEDASPLDGRDGRLLDAPSS